MVEVEQTLKLCTALLDRYREQLDHTDAEYNEYRGDRFSNIQLKILSFNSELERLLEPGKLSDEEKIINSIEEYVIPRITISHDLSIHIKENVCSLTVSRTVYVTGKALYYPETGTFGEITISQSSVAGDRAGSGYADINCKPDPGHRFTMEEYVDAVLSQ